MANNNSAGNCVVFGVLVDGGDNLTSDSSCTLTQTTSMTDTEPLLLPLASNGGETETHGLASSSPAINQIPLGVNGCGTTYTADQLGEPGRKVRAVTSARWNL